MAEGTSAATRDALCSMLKQLRANGVRDVHFLVHSLGSTVVLRSICHDPDERIARLFAGCDTSLGGSGGGEPDGGAASSSPSPSTTDGSPPLLRLKTFTLLHPDTSLKRFVRHDFAVLRRLCNHVTVMGDKHDQASPAPRSFRAWYKDGSLRCLYAAAHTRAPRVSPTT